MDLVYGLMDESMTKILNNDYAGMQLNGRPEL